MPTPHDPVTEAHQMLTEHALRRDGRCTCGQRGCADYAYASDVLALHHQLPRRQPGLAEAHLIGKPDTRTPVAMPDAA